MHTQKQNQNQHTPHLVVAQQPHPHTLERTPIDHAHKLYRQNRMSGRPRVHEKHYAGADFDFGDVGVADAGGGLEGGRFGVWGLGFGVWGLGFGV